MAQPVTAPRFVPVGDTGLSVQFGDSIDPVINAAVASLDAVLATAEIPGIVETVPSFRSVLIVYEPAILTWEALETRVRDLWCPDSTVPSPARKRWTIPVSYAAPHGEDLAEAAAILGLREEQVVSAHTAAEFRVYMLGFQPGLPNLGGLPPALHISRRSVPRAPVPPRSVAIGGVQGVIMTMATPTGFYLLGRTPVRPFDRRRDNPVLFQPGDRVRFRAIDLDEFGYLESASESGDLLAGACSEPL